MNTRLLTPEEVAERLRISRLTVMNHLRSGALKGIKVGRLWRISEEALAAFGYPSSSRGAMHVSDAASGQLPSEASGVCRDSLREAPYGVDESEADELDSRWLDSNWDKPLPPFDWGPDGIPPTKPVRYVPGKGLVIEGEKRGEPR